MQSSSWNINESNIKYLSIFFWLYHMHFNKILRHIGPTCDRHIIMPKELHTVFGRYFVTYHVLGRIQIALSLYVHYTLWNIEHHQHRVWEVLLLRTLNYQFSPHLIPGRQRWLQWSGIVGVFQLNIPRQFIDQIHGNWPIRCLETFGNLDRIWSKSSNTKAHKLVVPKPI